MLNDYEYRTFIARAAGLPWNSAVHVFTRPQTAHALEPITKRRWMFVSQFKSNSLHRLALKQTTLCAHQLQIIEPFPRRAPEALVKTSAKLPWRQTGQHREFSSLITRRLRQSFQPTIILKFARFHFFLSEISETRKSTNSGPTYAIRKKWRNLSEKLLLVADFSATN